MSIDTAIGVSPPIVLHMGAILSRISGEEFFRFCAANPDLRIERTESGDLIIMPPATGTSGRRNSALHGQLVVWSEADRTGVTFDSSTGFELPNGSTRSPDSAWVRRERWDALSPEQQDSFSPIAPDFAAELRSKSDRVTDLQDKMQEYIRNGVRLAWLIDPYERWVEVYRPGVEPVRLDNPPTLSGDPELPGFLLDLQRIW